MDKTILMEKVMAGKASPEEKKEFAQWLSESAANREELRHVQWLAQASAQAEHDSNNSLESWHKIQSRMNGIRQRRKWIRFVKFAIMFVLLLVVLYFLFHWLGEWTSSRRDWSAHIYKMSCTLAGLSPTPHASECQI
jgi:ferric-dicitrate binding protein FerR (iron transport regulator)